MEKWGRYRKNQQGSYRRDLVFKPYFQKNQLLLHNLERQNHVEVMCFFGLNLPQLSVLTFFFLNVCHCFLYFFITVSQKERKIVLHDPLHWILKVIHFELLSSYDSQFHALEIGAKMKVQKKQKIIDWGIKQGSLKSLTFK